MGKKGSHKRGQNVITWPQSSITLREESTGKKQTNVSAKSILKMQHIKSLAMWASGEASVSSLGPFFGHRLAACSEALGTPANPSLFTCQRCESILQPGCNCTIRIEKNRVKVQHRRKKTKLSSQNNVVYKCHFCSHRNLVKGTPRGHMKELYPPKAKAPLKPEPANNTLPKYDTSGGGTMKNVEVNKTSEVSSTGTIENVESTSTDILKDDPVTNNIVTPPVRVRTTLLEAKRRKTNRSGSKNAAESESSSAVIDAENAVSASSKRRRRKSWTSLKEIAEGVDHVNHRNLTNLTVPFFI